MELWVSWFHHFSIWSSSIVRAEPLAFSAEVFTAVRVVPSLCVFLCVVLQLCARPSPHTCNHHFPAPPWHPSRLPCFYRTSFARPSRLIPPVFLSIRRSSLCPTSSRSVRSAAQSRTWSWRTTSTVIITTVAAVRGLCDGGAAETMQKLPPKWSSRRSGLCRPLPVLRRSHVGVLWPSHFYLKGKLSFFCEAPASSHQPLTLHPLHWTRLRRPRVSSGTRRPPFFCEEEGSQQF